MAKVERGRMSTLTMGLAEAKNNFSRVTAEVNRTGRPVTILKNNRPWVVIQLAQQSESAVDVAVDFMDAYADVFEELAKLTLSRFLGTMCVPSIRLRLLASVALMACVTRGRWPRKLVPSIKEDDTWICSNTCVRKTI